MKLDHIHYLLEIYQTKSINKAAENLLLSQPYLSKCLKETEHDLGVKLVIRHPRGVEFTELGERFIEYATQIELYKQKIESIRLDFSKERILTISCFHSFNLIEMIHQLEEQKILTNIHLKCIETQNSNVFEWLKSSRADLGIIYLDTNNLAHYETLFQKNQLEFIPVHTDFIYAIMNSQHPLYTFSKLTKEDLLPYQLLIEQHKLNFIKENIDQHPLNTYFRDFQKETVLFDHHSSFLYYLTKVNHAFSIGQKNFNTSNPLVVHGSLKYIPIVDADVSLVTGFLFSSSHPLKKEIDKLIHEMTQILSFMTTNAPPLG